MPISVAAPTLKKKQEYTARELERRDLPDILELLHIVNRADDNDYYQALDDLEREYADPRSNPNTDARIFRNALGKLVAFARVFVEPKPTKENIAYLSCEIAPEAREQGLEEECIEWMQERAAECLAETARVDGVDALPRAMRVDFPETSPFRPFYQARGFESTRASYSMARALHEPIPENSLPPDLVLVEYTKDLDDAVRLACNEAFRDHWGHQDALPETWETGVSEVSDLRRDLSLVVMDGNEIAAFCVNFENTADNEMRGTRRGWIGVLGTRRPWRKRGIASALLAESMRRFHAIGFDSVALGVDTENRSGALRLYENLGFKPYMTRVILEKSVR